jgi:acetyl-CoA C-acetyltransferase
LKDVVIISGVRTAVGRFGGSLKSVPTTELAKSVMLEAVKRGNIGLDSIGKVIFGNCFSPVNSNIARIAAYQVGIPTTQPI